MAYSYEIAQGVRERVNDFLLGVGYGNPNTAVEPVDNDDPIVYRAAFQTNDGVLKKFSALVEHCEKIEYDSFLFLTDIGYFVLFAGKLQITGFLGTGINRVPDMETTGELVSMMKLQVIDYSLSERVMKMFYSSPGFEPLEFIERVLGVPYINKVKSNIASSTADPQPVVNFVGDEPV